MAYYNTRNPIPSIDPRDLSDNAQNFDKAMNDRMALSWADRFGTFRKSWAGLENDVSQFLAKSGFVNIGVYTAALVITASNQVFEKDGELYSPVAGLPLPYTLTGDWATESVNFVARGDFVLRQDLADPSKGVALVAGALRVAASLAELRTLDASKNPSVVVAGYYQRGDVISSLYYYDPSDTTSLDDGGAIVVTALGQRFKLNHSGRILIEQYGARGDGSDSTERIQAAIDYCAPRKIQLWAGPGTFGLNLNRTAAVNGYDLARCALLSRDGFTFYGSGMGVTILKVLDGETDKITATLPWFNVITMNTVGRNITLENVTIDVNGQNNPISRPGEEMPGYSCAGYMVTGALSTSGADARIYDSLFYRVQVINSPGVTGIGLGSRYGTPGITGDNVIIRECVFNNNGIDSKDHSSIFGFNNNTLVESCTFDHPTPSGGLRGPVVAVELHGAGTRMRDCTVRNYMQASWLVSGEEGNRHGIQVTGNLSDTNWWGHGVWTNSLWNDGLSDTIISGNVVRINAAPITNPAVVGAKYAFYVAVNDGTPMLRFLINGNIGYCTDRKNNTGYFIGGNVGSTTGPTMVSGNMASGFHTGYLVGAGSGGVISTMFKGNYAENCAPTTDQTSITYGFRFAFMSLFSLEFSGNTASSGDGGTAPQIGIELAGSAGTLFCDGNNVGDCPVGIQDTATVSGRRLGRQARQFAALPAQSTWQIGDTAYLHPAPLQGAGGSQYIMDGWQRMTDGTSNILNTDWRERRMLTGT